MQHILAIDQGTTSSTVLLLDDNLTIKGRGYQEFAQHYPQPGHVEHHRRHGLLGQGAAHGRHFFLGGRGFLQRLPVGAHRVDLVFLAHGRPRPARLT